LEAVILRNPRNLESEVEQAGLFTTGAAAGTWHGREQPGGTTGTLGGVIGGAIFDAPPFAQHGILVLHSPAEQGIIGVKEGTGWYTGTAARASESMRIGTTSHDVIFITNSTCLKSFYLSFLNVPAYSHRRIFTFWVSGSHEDLLRTSG
jgi:hypothetical protein